MIALLRNGDYCPDGMGGFRQAWGGEEVLERVHPIRKNVTSSVCSRC